MSAMGEGRHCRHPIRTQFRWQSRTSSALGSRMKQEPSDFTPEAATDEPASSLTPFAPALVRTRHDGFDRERKLLFLTALRQGASVLDACFMVGISNRTAYNHRR